MSAAGSALTVVIYDWGGVGVAQSIERGGGVGVGREERAKKGGSILPTLYETLYSASETYEHTF